MNKLKPSDFAGIFPLASVTCTCEMESTARSIMCFLYKYYNDEWHKMTFEEYTECFKKNDTPIPEYYKHTAQREFNNVIDYCTSDEKARTFSPAWNKIKI